MDVTTSQNKISTSYMQTMVVSNIPVKSLTSHQQKSLFGDTSVQTNYVADLTLAL